jgi:lipopolysaccharide export system protein LptA
MRALSAGFWVRDPTVLLLVALALALTPDAGAPHPRAHIDADRFTIDSKSHLAVYTGHAKVVRESTTITCERIEATYLEGHSGDDAIDRITATGNVEATDGDRWARGDQAVYENATGVLTATGNPRARQGNKEVEGEVVTFTTGIDKVVVTRARTRAEDEKAQGADRKVFIDADLLTLDQQRSTALWHGHVRARRGKTLITAPDLTAHYDDKGQVTRIEGRNGVEAFDGDRQARGQRADYDAVTGRMVLTGHPEARQGANWMKGSRITYVSGTNTTEVDNVVQEIEVKKK